MLLRQLFERKNNSNYYCLSIVEIIPIPINIDDMHLMVMA